MTTFMHTCNKDKKANKQATTHAYRKQQSNNSCLSQATKHALGVPTYLACKKKCRAEHIREKALVTFKTCQGKILGTCPVGILGTHPARNWENTPRMHSSTTPAYAYDKHAPNACTGKTTLG